MCGHFSDKEEEEEEFFRCGRPHFWRNKLRIFRNLLLCPHGQEGRRWASADIFRTNWEARGLIFSDFVQTSFMDPPPPLT